MKILFIRHGESTDDIDDQYGGWGDFHLTKKGKKQIGGKAKEIKKLNLKFEKIYSSPLLRAQESAEVLSKKLGVPREVFVYLKEKNGYGLLSGLKKSEARADYPELVYALENNKYVDGSIREDDFIKRIKKSIKLLKSKKEQNVIAVTHGGYLKYMFNYVLKKKLTSYEDGGWALIEIKGNKGVVLKSNGFEFI